MKLQIEKESYDITVSAEELSFFSRTKGNAAHIMNFTSYEADPYSVFSRSAELSALSGNSELEFFVTGKADCVYTEDDVWVLEKYRTVGKVTSRTTPFSSPQFLCECVLCAYMLSLEKQTDNICLRLMICDENGEHTKGFECFMGKSFLLGMWKAVTERALPFIAVQAERELYGRSALSKMAFPYTEIRDGQRDFINDAYYSARSGTRLMVCAPTGIGKTVSALYPALRAVGNGHIDKVFYLTAKTVTGNAAADAVRKMSSQVKSLRCCFVVAKDRVCPKTDRRNGACTLTCGRMYAIENVPFEKRRDEAMLSLLQGSNVIDTASIVAAAEKYCVCPYELSLDISEYCEVVICDYNYVFDANVRFRRYFAENTGEKYMFLVDEAHNLPDRVREMYSAEIDSNVFLQLYKTENEAVSSNRPLKSILAEAISQLKNVALRCKEEETVVGDNTYGYFLTKEVPEKLRLSLVQFCHVASKLSKTDPEAAEVMDDAYESARRFCSAATYANDKFVFFAESVNGRLKLSVRCLDPSQIIDTMAKSGKAAVFFSATFTPMDYFADVLGCSDAAQLELESPYDPDNLCVVGVKGVSTKYSVRADYVEDIAEMIMAAVQAKVGNYIVYFPSYEYMKKVYKAFAEIAFDCKFILQKQGMGYKERNKFLEHFNSVGEESLVGFCVLGGAFSEGVDLSGDKLIGVIIVGTGLPKLSAELNILQNYYDETRENGHDYAYTYPSMIKVQQAAGRVIRSEDDKGIVVLLDDRYSEPQTLRLLPKNWRKIKFAEDPEMLSVIAERFWEKQNFNG